MIQRRKLMFTSNEFSIYSRGMKVIDTLPIEIKNKKIKKPVHLNSLRDKVQREFNKFIRHRDKDKGCVSCKSGKVEQASHFFSAGQYTALRFSEDNCHGSCLRCNYFLSGNLLHYRETLIKRIGIERFNLLESTATRQRVRKWQRFELEALYVHYKILNVPD